MTRLAEWVAIGVAGVVTGVVIAVVQAAVRLWRDPEVIREAEQRYESRHHD
jgi:hypothetical protein